MISGFFCFQPAVKFAVLPEIQVTNSRVIYT
jgi:hypothetical protein